MAKSMLWLVVEIAGQVRFAPDAERVVYHRWLAGHIRGSGPTAQMSVASGLPTSEYWLTDERRKMTRSETTWSLHFLDCTCSTPQIGAKVYSSGNPLFNVFEVRRLAYLRPQEELKWTDSVQSSRCLRPPLSLSENKAAASRQSS